jgi:hypothetical protein
VIDRDEEAARVLPDALVVAEAHLERLVALELGALAPEADELVGLPGELSSFDRLVDAPEQSLVPGELAVNGLIHRPIVAYRLSRGGGRLRARCR